MEVDVRLEDADAAGVLEGDWDAVGDGVKFT